MELKLSYFLELSPDDYDKYLDIMKWCLCNCKKSWSHLHHLQNVSNCDILTPFQWEGAMNPNKFINFFFYFEDKNDAMFFKLTWL